MKFFVFLVVAVLIAGGIYHNEVTDYIADLSNGSYGSYGSGGGSSLVGSVRSVGNASSAAFGKVGNAFGH